MRNILYSRLAILIILLVLVPLVATAMITLKDSYMLDIERGKAVESDVALGDVSGNGRPDIVVGCRDGNVYCLDGSGNFLWIVNTGDAVVSPPAIADVNNDRRNEVIIGSDDGSIYCISGGGTVLWTKETGGQVRSGACIADVDGDSSDDIIIGSDDGFLYALDGNGNDIIGWPIELDGPIETTPSAYDVDFDDLVEIAVGTDGGSMYLIDNDGKVVPGWPVDARYYIRSSPVIGDIDNDGLPEIVAGSDDFNVYAWKPNGSICAGWPVTTGYKISKASPALVDIDGDKQLDIILGSGDSNLYVWNGQGEVLPGFPIQTHGRLYNSSPVVADINGDSIYDIVVGAEDAQIYMFSATGDELPDSPYMTMGAIHSSPALGDIDGDGLLELVIGNQAGELMIFDTSGSALSARTSTWNQFQHDRWKSGVYGYMGGATIVPTCEMKEFEGEQSGDITFEYRLEDPQKGSMDIRCEFSQDWGHRWSPATILGSTSSLSQGWHTITWQSSEDMISPDERDGVLDPEDRPDAWREYREQKDVIFRIVPENYLSTGKAAETGLMWVDNNRPPIITMNEIKDEQSKEVYLDYNIVDEEHDLINIKAYYSLDLGTTWKDANIEGATVDIRAARYEGNVTWMSDKDVDELDSETLQFKLVAEDSDPGTESIVTALHIDNNHLPESFMIDIEEEKAADFEVAYKIEDREGDELSIRGEYSLDNGETWLPATLSGTVEGISATEYENSVTWNSRLDTLGKDVVTTQFKVIPIDNDEGIGDATGSFHLDNNDTPTLAIDPIIGEQSGAIEIAYNISDPESDEVTLTAEYFDTDVSTPDGGEWKIATVAGITTEISPAGYSGSLVWDSLVDMLGHNNPNTRFRITAADNDVGEPFEANPFFVDNNSDPSVMLADLTAEQSNDVEILYTLSDLEQDTLSFVCEFSKDDGATWLPATISGNTEGFTPDNYMGSITWRSYEDTANLHIDSARFRIIASDEDTGSPGMTSPFTIDNNNPPTVDIATMTEEQSGEVLVAYDLRDDESDAVSILMDYSEDNGQTWIPASVSGETDSVVPGTRTITWLSDNDVPGVDKDNMMLRIIAEDADRGEPGILSQIHIDNSAPPSIALTNIEGEQNGDIVIEYTIIDSENDIVNLKPEFTEDGGMSWWPASVDGITDEIYSSGYLGTMVWHSDTDLPGTDQTDIAFRLTPGDNDVGEPGRIDNFHLDNNEISSIRVETPVEEQSGNISIAYTLDDPESDASAILVEYSPDGGFTWKEASVATDTQINPSNYSGTIVWVSENDLPAADRDDVMIRVTPLDNDEGISDVTGTIHLDNNSPPTITATNLTEEITGDVAVSYSIADDEGSEVEIRLEVSADNGASWTEATVSGSIIGISPNEYTGSFVWSSFADLPGRGFDNVQLKITPVDNDKGEPYIMTGIHVDNNDAPVITLGDLYDEQVNQIPISYSVTDTEDDTVSLIPSYSIDGGTNWQTPTISSGSLTGISRSDYIGEIVWNAAADVKGVDNDNVIFRIIAKDIDEGSGGMTAPFNIDTNDPPVISVSPPSETGGDMVPIGYNIADAEGDSVTIVAEYSSDGGFTWEEATVGGAISGISPGGYQGNFDWNASEDISGLDSSEVKMRLLPSDGDPGEFAESEKFRVDVNSPPKVVIQPVIGEQTGEIMIEFDLDDVEGDPLSIRPEYSTDGGGSWRPATVNGTTSDISSLMYSTSIYWDAGDDIGSVDSESILFRITPSDNDEGATSDPVAVHIDSNEPPTVEVSISGNETSGDVPVTYRVSDAEGDIVSLIIEYSVDGGFNFLPATTDRNLSSIGPGSYSGSFNWLATTDAPGEDVTSAAIRIIPSDKDEGEHAISTSVRVDNNNLPSAAVSALNESARGDEVEVVYSLRDDEGDPLTITPEFSIDDGVSWRPATVFGLTSDIGPESYNGKLVWAIESDIPGEELSGVTFRITPYDSQMGKAGISRQLDVDTNYPPEISLTDLFGEQETNSVLIDYVINDNEGDNLNAVCEYSTNGGTSWNAATIDGGTSISATEYFSSFSWNVARDLGDGFMGDVIFKVAISDSSPGNIEQTTPFTVDLNEPPSINLTNFREDSSTSYIPVNYKASDKEGDTIELICEYTEDGGFSWQPATLESSATIEKAFYSGKAVWNRPKDIPSVLDGSEILFRITPDDADPGEPSSIAVPIKSFEAPEILQPEDDE